LNWKQIHPPKKSGVFLGSGRKIKPASRFGPCGAPERHGRSQNSQNRPQPVQPLPATKKEQGAIEPRTAAHGQQPQDVVLLLPTSGHDTEHLFDKSAGFRGAQREKASRIGWTFLCLAITIKSWKVPHFQEPV